MLVFITYGSWRKWQWNIRLAGNEPVLEIIGHEYVPPGVALLARKILPVAGIGDVVVIVVSIRIAIGPLHHTVIGQVALRFAAHHSGVEASLVDVLHLLAPVPVQLGLQRAASATLPVVRGALIGVESLEHRPGRLAAIVEECLFARLIRGAGPDVLLRAINYFRAGGSSGAIGLFAADSRFIRVFGGVL